MAFEGLSEKLNSVFKGLRGKGRLTEEDIKLACARCAWRCSRQT